MKKLLAAIRACIGVDHTNWDTKLNEINGALRSAIHLSTGYSPYFLAFGQNMLLNGKDYELLRILDLLIDHAY